MLCPNWDCRFLPLGDDWDGAQKGGGGMNGFHDVIVALQWLRDNVGAFGGSPDEVTLFGQSSGGWVDSGQGCFETVVLRFN